MFRLLWPEGMFLVCASAGLMLKWECSYQDIFTYLDGGLVGCDIVVKDNGVGQGRVVRTRAVAKMPHRHVDDAVIDQDLAGRGRRQVCQTDLGGMNQGCE